MHIISKASAFGKVIYIQILAKIILFYFSDVSSLSRPNSYVFQEKFPLFVTSHNTQIYLWIGLFPSGMSSKLSFTGL